MPCFSAKFESKAGDATAACDVLSTKAPEPFGNLAGQVCFSGATPSGIAGEIIVCTGGGLPATGQRSVRVSDLPFDARAQAVVPGDVKPELIGEYHSYGQ